MKKIFNIIVYVTVIMAMSSCDFFDDDDKSSKDAAAVRTIVELPDSVKQKIVEQDALMTELLNKVDTLTAELNATKTENVELKEKVAELKSPKSTWAYVSMGAFILGLAALLVALFMPKGVKEEKAYDIFKDCLDESGRIKELQNNVGILLASQQKNRGQQSNIRFAPNVETRISYLESQMNQVISAVNKMISGQATSTNRSDPANPQKATDYYKVGYAKVDTDKYFTTIYDSSQEGCVFKITFTNQSKGKFTLISLDKIQSRNDWQKKIECSGVSIKEASNFRVEDLGICEKIDENTWQVTQPLKIRLLK